MPRTLAMMAVSPIIGKLYNRVQPAFIVGFGVILFAIGSWQLSNITLDTSARDLVFPLVVTGAAFACLFVPLTTAALSRTPRHLMADAAGLNSFVRQIGGSIGLTIFATMFTNYAVEARAGIARNLTMLRPEVASHVAAINTSLVHHGMNAMNATMGAGKAVAMSWYAQSTVLSFDRVFIFQGILFLGVIPLLFFLRVPRATRRSAARHVNEIFDGVIMATSEAHPTNGTEPAPKATVVSPVPKKKKATRAYLLLAGLAFGAVAIYFIHGYVTLRGNEVETDDAEVDADVAADLDARRRRDLEDGCAR